MNEIIIVLLYFFSLQYSGKAFIDLSKTNVLSPHGVIAHPFG